MSLVSKYSRIHPLYHTPSVGFREMGVPLDHSQGLVPERLSDLGQAGHRHGEVGGCGVPQVVAPKIYDAYPHRRHSVVIFLMHAGIRRCRMGKYFFRLPDQGMIRTYKRPREEAFAGLLSRAPIH